MQEPRIAYKDLLSQKRYLLVLLVNTFANFGFMMFQVGFFWLVYDMTKGLEQSAFIAGGMILGASSPYLIFGLIGGVYADRLNKKKIIVISNLVSALILTGVPILYMSDLLTVWHVALSAFGVVSLRCFYSPAIRSLVPQVLPSEYWPAGNSVFQILSQLSKTISPALGGVLIAQYSAMSVYVVFLLLLLFSALLIFPLRIRAAVQLDKRVSVYKDIKETFIFMSTIKPLFWTIMLFGAVLLFQTGIERLGLPIVSDTEWEMGPEGFGIILATFGVGNIIGAVWLGKIKMKSYTHYIYTGWALWGSAIALVGLSPWLALALIFALIAGIAEAMNDLPMVLMIQRFTPENRLGKVFSVWSTVAFVGESGSSLLAGMIIGMAGLHAAFVVLWLSLVLIGLAGFILTREAVIREKAV
ncbi:MFS transporter [Salipaludibacillus aurantiacus]|uniref:Transmembrane secretion effector n=1 Tax=Salipaludibacillus aurantiacus TaxID=1601833 RepID=A0A1H9QEK7_9BACI|nr:MFS transporter [Salipaludibacillus aurantiacus]SER58830.1 Transmembrane secretion effector [Salipaludibacillus aurantiacus]